MEGRGKVEGNWRPRPWVRRDGEGRGTGRQRSSGRLALGQGSRSPPRMGWRLLQVAGLGVRGRGGKGAESYSRTGGRRPRRRTRPVRPGRQVYIGLACSVGQSSSRGGHLRACGFQRGRPGFRMRVSNPAHAILPPGYHVHRRVCTGQLGQVRGTGRVLQRRFNSSGSAPRLRPTTHRGVGRVSAWGRTLGRITFPPLAQRQAQPKRS